MTTMTAMSSRAALALVGMIALSGCGHRWPEHGSGGLAERDMPVEAALVAAETAIDEARLNGAGGRARIQMAEDHLVVAIRENEAGLRTDADDNLLAASIALGGVDQLSPARTLCLKEPCR